MMIKLKSIICVLLLFAITLFEYGSYRLIPLFSVAIFLLILKSRTIIRLDSYAGIYILITMLFIGILYKFDFSYDKRWLSFTSWSIIAILSSFKIRAADYVSASAIVIKIHIIIALIDLMIFSFMGLDLSSLIFGLESRHITYAKPYLRATGLMGEPGTLAAMVMCLSLMARPKASLIVFVFMGVLTVKSPYMLLAFFTLLFKRYSLANQPRRVINFIVLGMVLILPVFLVMYSRVLDILTGEDSSFLFRVEAFVSLVNSKYIFHGAWFSSSHLVADIGLIAELFFQFGVFYGFLLTVIIGSSHLLLLIVKLKGFVGFLPFFLVYRFREGKRPISKSSVMDVKANA